MEENQWGQVSNLVLYLLGESKKLDGLLEKGASKGKANGIENRENGASGGKSQIRERRAYGQATSSAAGA